MRGAALDWLGQGDVWAKVAALRPTSAPPPPRERAGELTATIRKLRAVDAHGLCGPLDAYDEWVAVFERAGAFADFVGRSALTRGLRALIAHHVIFHANRGGLLRDDRSALSNTAREVVMGTSDNTASPDEATAGAISVRAVNTDTIAPTHVSYEYEGAALWNAHAGMLWRRFSIYLRREIAKRAARPTPHPLCRLRRNVRAHGTGRGVVHRQVRHQGRRGHGRRPRSAAEFRRAGAAFPVFNPILRADPVLPCPPSAAAVVPAIPKATPAARSVVRSGALNLFAQLPHLEPVKVRRRPGPAQVLHAHPDERPGEPQPVPVVVRELARVQSRAQVVPGGSVG